jgi:YD repeat-containing protein
VSIEDFLFRCVAIQPQWGEKKMGKKFIRSNSWFRVSFTITVCLVISLLLITEARAENVTYGYDELGRLIRVTYENGTEITYTYDQVGNRQTKTVQIVAESISVPSTPTGPANGDIGTSYAYLISAVGESDSHSFLGRRMGDTDVCFSNFILTIFVK